MESYGAIWLVLLLEEETRTHTRNGRDGDGEDWTLLLGGVAIITFGRVHHCARYQLRVHVENRAVGELQNPCVWFKMKLTLYFAGVLLGLVVFIC